MIKLVTQNPDKYDWDLFANISEVENFLDQNEIIPFDIETTGLSCMDHEIICWQTGDEQVQYVIDQESYPVQKYKKVLESKTLLGQNLAFDLTFLYAQNVICTKVIDTYIAEILLSLGLLQYGRGYGDIVERHLGITLDKSMQEEINEVGLTREAIAYSGNDIKYLLPIHKIQSGLIDRRGMSVAYRLENRFVPVLAYLEFSGIYIDTDDWYKLVRRLEYEEYGAELALNEYVKEYGIEEINWASSAQVETLFREVFGIDTHSNKLGRATVDAGHLMSQDHDIIPLYLEYKRKAKAVSTYGRAFLDYPKEDKRIHTKFKQLVSTGRMSSGDSRTEGCPNLQNIPSDDAYRKCFKGQAASVLITCDYSAQEGVILADVSGEPNMIQFYKEGGDIHSYVAQQVWPSELKGLSPAEIKEKHSDKRFIAKSVGFSVAYGGTAYTIASNLNIGRSEAIRIYNSYMNYFPKLKEYFKKVSTAAKKKGYVLLNEKTGHKRYIGGWREWKESLHPDRKFEGMMYRQALNSPIQGCLPHFSRILDKERGWVTVGDFTHGKVWTGNTWANAFKIPKGEAERIHLHLSDGRIFTCDNRHKLLCNVGKSYPEWIHVDDIVGKELVRSEGDLHWGNPDKEEEDWYWAGRLLGDGFINSKGYSGLVFNDKCYDDMKAYTAWLESKGMLTSTYGKSYYIDPNKTSSQVRMSNLFSYEQVWEPLGLPKNFITSTKRVPKHIFQLDYARRLSFFKGWYDADGSRSRKRGGVIIQGNRYNLLTTKTAKMSRDCLQLLQTLGISGISKKHVYNRPNKGMPKTYYWYTITIHANARPITVVSREDTGIIEPMYTLSVDDARHSFSNEGFISKNSATLMTKLAGIYLFDWILKNKRFGKVKLVNIVHDELVVEVNQRVAEKTAEVVQDCMERAGSFFLDTLSIKAEPNISKSWVK